MDRGREVVPVHPELKRLLGTQCYPSFAAIPEVPSLAVIFHRGDAAVEAVHEAISAGVRGIWLQEGFVSKAARTFARDHGAEYIEDRDIKTELLLARR
jgi:predicted CoA-binding protein